MELSLSQYKMFVLFSEQMTLRFQFLASNYKIKIFSENMVFSKITDTISKARLMGSMFVLII